MLSFHPRKNPTWSGNFPATPQLCLRGASKEQGWGKRHWLVVMGRFRMEQGSHGAAFAALVILVALLAPQKTRSFAIKMAFSRGVIAVA